MHNITKIKIFRALLWIIYPIALIFVYPFAQFKGKKKSSLFFFLDRYAIGGAQRVYLEILESVNDIQKTVFFTRKSEDNKLRNDFIHFLTLNVMTFTSGATTCYSDYSRFTILLSILTGMQAQKFWDQTVPFFTTCFHF